MKRLIFTILMLLPLFINGQQTQQFSAKENPWFDQIKKTGTLLDQIQNSIPGKYRFPYLPIKNQNLMNEDHVFLEKSNLPNGSIINQETWIQILKSTSQDTVLLDSTYTYLFHSPTDSVLHEKILYNYNPSGKQYTITTAVWDTLMQKWYFSTKEDIFFDQNGNDTLWIAYQLSMNDIWTYNQKTVKTYDESNRQTSLAFYLWNNLIQQWHGEYKLVNEYDENGNNTLSAYYIWNDVRQNWQGSSKSERTYNDHNLMISYINYQWDFKTYGWIPLSRTENTYNEQDTQISYTSSIWNPESGVWVYVYKSESETIISGTNYWHYSAYYEWDNLFGRWKGLDKIEYFRTGPDEEIQLIDYEWNALEEKWEAAIKTIQDNDEAEMKYTISTFASRDSIVQGELIAGFENREEFSNIWITSSCPDQTCTSIDTDRVEGNASILWNYNINGNFYSTGGFCQVQINANKDLSQYAGLSMDYKVLVPSVASFSLRITETSGEVWMYQSSSLPADSSGQWQQIVFPFSEMIGTGSYIDGLFDYQHIKNIQMRLHVPNGIKTSGTLLIDNLAACTVMKTDQWILTAVEEYYYDEHGNTVFLTSKIWDDGSGQYVDDYKYKAEFDYNQNGLVTSYEAFVWQDTLAEWINYRKETNEYNQNWYRTYTESYSWDPNQNKWTGVTKIEQTYTETGAVLVYMPSAWDTLTDSWIYTTKTVNTYTTNGILNSTANYTWNSSVQKWIGNDKFETFFNSMGQELKTIFYIWNSEEDEWMISWISLAGNYAIIYTPDWKIATEIFMIWNDQLNDWSPIEKTYYFWSSHTITDSPEELSTNNILEVYPNPATDVIHIRLNSRNHQGTYSLFDNQGRLLKKSSFTGTINKIPVHDLPSGLYILHIATDGENIAIKMVIR